MNPWEPHDLAVYLVAMRKIDLASWAGVAPPKWVTAITRAWAEVPEPEDGGGE